MAPPNYMNLTTLFFIRHGEVYNPKEVIYARLPHFHLSERGIQESETTARYLKREPLKAIYSSPMLRALQTARIIQNFHPDAPLRISRHLNELQTSYQGMPRSEIQKNDWNFYDFRLSPADETREDILARMLKQLRLTLNRHAGQSVAWVAHGDPVILLTLWGQGTPLTDLQKYKGKTYIAHASATKFVFAPEHALPLSVEYVDPNRLNEHVT